MIKVSLCVDDICHNCPRFIPEYGHIQGGSVSGETFLKSITIKWKHSNFCSFIREYVRKEKLMNKNNSTDV